MTVSLIVVNAVVFLYEFSLGERVEQFVLYFGLVPAAFSFVSLFTSMFLHGGFLHFAGNMLYLWIFGDNVEDTLGHFRFLAFYLLAGIGAAMAQTFMQPQSRVPMIGASGAISGVLGAYLFLFPHASVLTLVTFGFFIRFIHIPAVIVLGFWIVVQVLYGVISMGRDEAGVAWFAHIGGFVAGIALLFLFRPRGKGRL